MHDGNNNDLIRGRVNAVDNAVGKMMEPAAAVGFIQRLPCGWMSQNQLKRPAKLLETSSTPNP
jgi:hypothetical protein